MTTKAKYNARMRKWRATNRASYNAQERVRRARRVAADPSGYAEKARARTLRKYGLTPETWLSMFEAQGRCCAICKSTDSFGRWHTDHDDTVGLTAVRGILCVRCNIGLGQFLDNPDLLLQAIDYLRRNR